LPDRFNDIERIILDYLDGIATPEDLILLKDWIALEYDNKIELKHFRELYIATSSHKSGSIYNEDLAWGDLRSKCLTILPKEKSTPSKSFFIPFLKIAALIIFVFASGFFAYRFFISGNSSDTISYSEYNVPRGSRSHIFLPDGTSVWLNAGSSLKYNQLFGQDKREVSLEGEAYFEVVRNEKIPFIVKASEATVKVLGTTFNVKAYPDENFIETTVVQGKVQVSSPQTRNEGQELILLLANQKVKILKEQSVNELPQLQKNNIDTTGDIAKKITPVAINKVDFSSNIIPQVYTSWKDSQWIIEREQLKDLAVKIERRYNVRVVFRDIELKEFVFSGKLKDESLEQVLQAISSAAPIEYSIKQNDILLYRNQKFK